jgi:hypothetical protein
MLLVNPIFLSILAFNSATRLFEHYFLPTTLTKLMPTQHRLLKWGRDLLIVSVAAQIGTALSRCIIFNSFRIIFC